MWHDTLTRVNVHVADRSTLHALHIFSFALAGATSKMFSVHPRKDDFTWLHPMQLRVTMSEATVCPVTRVGLGGSSLLGAAQGSALPRSPTARSLGWANKKRPASSSIITRL